MNIAIPARHAAPARAHSYASHVLRIMFAINFLNYMDRFILPSALSSIQKEFHITDFEAGLLATAFTLVYAMAALPFGLWADRGIRKNVVAVGVGLWSLATLLTGAAANFLSLFMARAAVGVGEAGYYPAGTSLLVDYFPKEKRAWMLGVWNVGASLGVAVGFATGGVIADLWGWRWAFYFTIIPGALCALLAYRMREPVRGGKPDVLRTGTQAETSASMRTPAEPAPPYMASVRRVLDVRTMRFAVIAQTMNFFVIGAAVLWFPTLLQRRFQMSSGTAGADQRRRAGPGRHCRHARRRLARRSSAAALPLRASAGHRLGLLAQRPVAGLLPASQQSRRPAAAVLPSRELACRPTTGQ